ARSGTISPMVLADWPLRIRAASFGSYPNLRMAARTRAAVRGLTNFPPFTTRDTVMLPTPHSRATSAIVGLPDGFLGMKFLVQDEENASSFSTIPASYLFLESYYKR